MISQRPRKKINLVCQVLIRNPTAFSNPYYNIGITSFFKIRPMTVFFIYFHHFHVTMTNISISYIFKRAHR